MLRLFAVAWLWFWAAAAPADLEQARDRQDLPALRAAVASLAEAAAKAPNDADLHYRLALAGAFLAEASLELGDRTAAVKAAETAIPSAQRAVTLQGDVSEYHRVLGVLCGQAVPGNLLAAVKHARCASSSLERALQLAPDSPQNYLSRGVGAYYLPPAFGGGVEPAIEDFRKAVQLNPKSADAYLWLGIALRKAGRNAEAREALRKSLELNPRRLWTKQQLAKTPAK